jgi:hypothetical protein
MELVNKGEIPDFLTQEGRRILIYAKNLKEVADKSKDKKKKRSSKRSIMEYFQNGSSSCQKMKINMVLNFQWRRIK